MYFKLCKYCRSSYQARRSQSLFCSTSCRVQYNKLDSTLSAKAANANGGIQDLMALLKRFPEKANEVDNQLQWLQGQIALARLTLPQFEKK